MKRIKVFGILLFWGLLIGTTLSHAADVAGPKAVFKEDSYDFKEVKEGTTLVHEFHVLNTGIMPLKIKQVNPG